MTHFWMFDNDIVEHRCYAEGDYDSSNGKWWGMRYRELIVKNGKVENSFQKYECDTDERTVGMNASPCIGKFNELFEQLMIGMYDPDGEIENSEKSIFEIRIQKFCYIQVIVFDLSYLPVTAVWT